VTVADTSFLFALFGNDAHTGAAQGWARQTTQPIAVTTLNRYEFANAIRFAVFRKAISASDGVASLAAFDTDLRRGVLQPTPCDLAAVVSEAERLSESHSLTGGHRSFDLLHVATARVLKATTFLTFDRNQRKLAGAVRLAVDP
jgi:predicted nucleic acid-binding protein